LAPNMTRLADRWANLDRRWILLALSISWLAGLGLTIHNGVNPGICC
jgi:hypothetical protein